MDYADVVTIYGVSRAGFVPQLISLHLSNETVVYELLKKATAKALIFDPSFENVIQDSPLPAYVALSPQDSAELDSLSLPPPRTAMSRDDLVFVFHTSGSTSGIPKLVPCTAAWVDSQTSRTVVISALRKMTCLQLVILPMHTQTLHLLG